MKEFLRKITSHVKKFFFSKLGINWSQKCDFWHFKRLLIAFYPFKSLDYDILSFENSIFACLRCQTNVTSNRQVGISSDAVRLTHTLHDDKIFQIISSNVDSGKSSWLQCRSNCVRAQISICELNFAFEVLDWFQEACVSPICWDKSISSSELSHHVIQFLWSKSRQQNV